MGISLSPSVVFSDGRFHKALLTTVCHQFAAIEPQTPDMKCACICQRAQCAIVHCGDMLGDVIPARMEDTAHRFRLPAVAFELVAGMTTVDQVVECIASAQGTRLKMVYGQLRANVGLTNPALAATEVVLRA
jgi:hypothetical protein